MIILKEQKFDDLPAFSKAMALTQQAVAKVVRAQVFSVYGDPKAEFNVLMGCLVGVLRESLQQISYLKAEKRAKEPISFKLLKDDLDKLSEVFDKADYQIENIMKKSNLSAKK
jgi:hypothetical protein